jgi:hypothetical protein
MEFTTALELHSQATRLFETGAISPIKMPTRGSHPLRRPLPGHLDTLPAPTPALELTTRMTKSPDYKFELFPLHSPLLGESLLVSFPPLTDMLKFSGSSYLI